MYNSSRNQNLCKIHHACLHENLNVGIHYFLWFIDMYYFFTYMDFQHNALVPPNYDDKSVHWEYQRVYIYEKTMRALYFIQNILPHTVFHQFPWDTRRRSLGKDLYNLHHFYKLQLSTFLLLFRNFFQSIHLRRCIRTSQFDQYICHYSSMDCICNHQHFLFRNSFMFLH